MPSPGLRNGRTQYESPEPPGWAALALKDYKALAFDVHGTLIYRETGKISGPKPFAETIRGLTRNQILEVHAFHKLAAWKWTPAKPPSQVLATVFKRLAEE